MKGGKRKRVCGAVRKRHPVNRYRINRKPFTADLVLLTCSKQTRSLVWEGVSLKPEIAFGKALIMRCTHCFIFFILRNTGEKDRKKKEEETVPVSSALGLHGDEGVQQDGVGSSTSRGTRRRPSSLGSWR